MKLIPNVKKHWKRPLAAFLATALVAGNVDWTQFMMPMTTYAFSRWYGVCTDNHNFRIAERESSAIQ